MAHIKVKTSSGVSASVSLQKRYRLLLDKAFVRGVVSVMSVPHAKIQIRSRYDDGASISSDWRRVGESIRHSMITISQ